MSVLTIVVVVGVVGYVITRQLLGEPLRGKRIVVLPAVLAVVGGLDLARGHHPLGGADIGLIGAEAVVAVAIGVGQGASMRLEARNGTLWGRMPRRSVWLWVGLVASHGLLDLVAVGAGAHVAAGTAPILMLLGANRLAQAAVITTRAFGLGIPFATEKDGSTVLGGMVAPVATGGRRPTPPSSRRSDATVGDTPRTPGDGRSRSLTAAGVQTVAAMIVDRLEARSSRR